MTDTITAKRSVRLDDLAVEAESPRVGSEKRLFTFDKSLESIKARRFQRHLRSYEAFKMLINAIENPNSRYKSISDDMLSSYGEWFSLALIQNNGRLTTYDDPFNLVFKNDEYLVRGHKLIHSRERTFKIPREFRDGGYIELKKLPKGLVTLLYSRPANRLPVEIRNNSGLYLPQEGILRPCGRGYDFGDFDVGGYYDRASRGVRVAKN